MDVVFLAVRFSPLRTSRDLRLRRLRLLGSVCSSGERDDPFAVDIERLAAMRVRVASVKWKRGKVRLTGNQTKDQGTPPGKKNADMNCLTDR
jgi:hypothetical protein